MGFDSRNFFEKQLLGSTPTLLTIPHSLALCARNIGRLPRQLEFPLTLQQLRQSPFAKGSWGLTYVNKTREAKVLLAGSTLNTCLEIGKCKLASIKQIVIDLYCLHQNLLLISQQQLLWKVEVILVGD